MSESVVCDADLHVMEPPDLWQRYIAAGYQHAAPVGMTELRRDIRVKVKSEVLLRVGPVRPLRERGGSGIGWREEQEAAYAEYEAQDLSKRPSEYFREQCFVSVEADEEPATHYVERFGDRNLVFSTDYPHGDSQYPRAVETFRKLPLSDDTKQRVLGENWSRLYGVPLAIKARGAH